MYLAHAHLGTMLACPSSATLAKVRRLITACVLACYLGWMRYAVDALLLDLEALRRELLILTTGQMLSWNRDR